MSSSSCDCNCFCIALGFRFCQLKLIRVHKSHEKNYSWRFEHSFGTISEWEHVREARCVLLGDIPIPEWTEYYSSHSAPEGGMNRIILKTVYSEERNKSKKCSFRKMHEPAILFWLFSLPLISSQANSSHEWNHFRITHSFVDNIPCNPLFSFRVFSFWNNPKRMPP